MSSNETAEAPPLPARKSLRARAWFATLAVLVYIVASVGYITAERGRIYASTQALEENSRHEKALALAEAAIGGALVDVNELSNAARPEPGPASDLTLYMENCARLFRALEPFDPAYALLQRAIARAWAALQAEPARASWLELRETLRRAADEVDIRRRRLADERDALNVAFQRHYDAVTIETLAFATIGVVGFGSLAAWFFARLARDVHRLEEHARRIVHGQRGVALAVAREDELGRLMHAVNRMAVDLDARERQIELAGRRHAHQDKMLAVGALAAGVAHEVNNPLAVIAGVAEELRSAPAPLPQDRLAESAQMILAQTQRAAQVARQLAEVAAPAPSAQDWVDVNALVRRVVQLMGYDRRYRSFVFDLAADPALPAVRTDANAVQQVLMQMLGLGCDAMVAAQARPLRVELATAAAADGVEASICFPPVLDFGRAEVQRSLLLARATVEPLGGRLAFGQAGGQALRIKLTVPAESGS